VDARHKAGHDESLWWRLFTSGHVLQIGDDVADVLVAQQIRRPAVHLHRRPAAHRFRVADQRVQPLVRHVFGRIHRQVEIGADVGSAGAVQFVTRQALRDIESLSGASGIVRRQRLIDGKRGPARGRRELALKLRQLVGQYSLRMLEASGLVHTM
jgi:hypothetical protein